LRRSFFLRRMRHAMRLDVVLKPSDLRPEYLQGRAVVVFDVLRATTTMTAALAAGVGEIRIFDTIQAALAGAGDVVGGVVDRQRPLLCGEVNCLPPPGFDLGNSPGVFDYQSHRGRTLLMATTNGTRAIVAARGAEMLLVGALVNAQTVARVLARSAKDITLLCAGTAGAIAIEDILGAGAVIAALADCTSVEALSDTPVLARYLFQAKAGDLAGALAQGRGGKNVLAAGLPEDIAYAARLNVIDVVGRVYEGPLRVTSI